MKLTDMQILGILRHNYLSDVVETYQSDYLSKDPDAEFEALKLLIDEGFIDEDAILADLEEGDEREEGDDESDGWGL